MIDGKAMKYFPKNFIVFQGPNDDFKTSKCLIRFILMNFSISKMTFSILPGLTWFTQALYCK